MPSKASSASNKSTKPKGPSKAELEAIKQYLAQKPDFDKLIRDAKSDAQEASFPQQSETTPYGTQFRAAVRESLEDKREDAEATKPVAIIMPVQPKEEEAGSSA